MRSYRRATPAWPSRPFAFPACPRCCNGRTNAAERRSTDEALLPRCTHGTWADEEVRLDTGLPEQRPGARYGPARITIRRRFADPATERRGARQLPSPP